uniref:Secreted protein n=1 Tax=Angiostrongylus cantonensis TaxID=6313 RepID=A0A158P9S6_ANGCA
MIKWRPYYRTFLQLLLLGLCVTVTSASRAKHDNCKSEKLRELVLETVGTYPHQYSYQAKYMKQQAEERFGNWWSAVIIGDRGGYGMSAVYDRFKNTRYSLSSTSYGLPIIPSLRVTQCRIAAYFTRGEIISSVVVMSS